MLIATRTARKISGGVLEKFMLLCYDDVQVWKAAGYAAIERAMNKAMRLTHETNAKGQYLDVAPLHPVSTATSVRVRDGKPVVTDGSFAEAREVLANYYLIDVDNLDETIRIAERHPGARKGTVEIRPVFDLPGLPPERPYTPAGNANA